MKNNKKQVDNKKINKKVDCAAEQQKQYESMIVRRGTQAKWGEAELYLTANEMERYYGERCEEFDSYCESCQAWLEWNKTGKARLLFERDVFIKLLEENHL